MWFSNTGSISLQPGAAKVFLGTSFSWARQNGCHLTGLDMIQAGTREPAGSGQTVCTSSREACSRQLRFGRRHSGTLADISGSVESFVHAQQRFWPRPADFRRSLVLARVSYALNIF